MVNEFKLCDKSRIIGKKINCSKYIVTNDLNATLDDVYSRGAIMNGEGEIISPELLIGVLTKSGYWEDYENLIFKKK